jgi:hypothetical protein
MKTRVLIFALRDQEREWSSHHGYVVVGVRLSKEAQRKPVIERMAAGFYGPGKTKYDATDPPRRDLGRWFGGSFDLIMELEGQLRLASCCTPGCGNFQVMGDQRCVGIYEAEEVLKKPST